MAKGIDPFRQLAIRTEEIWVIMREMDSARALPESWAGEARLVGTSFRESDAAKRAIRVIQDRYSEERRQAGIVERDERLLKLGQELDDLRRELVELAAAASFHLIDVAREAKESGNG